MLRLAQHELTQTRPTDRCPRSHLSTSFATKAATNAAPSNRALVLAFISVRVLEQFRTRARTLFLRSVLRSSKILLQNRAIVRNSLRKRNYELPCVSNDMQPHENLWKPLSLNYKSAALPAELYRRFPYQSRLFASSSRATHGTFRHV
jgi:hypothetical protein